MREISDGQIANCIEALADLIGEISTVEGATDSEALEASDAGRELREFERPISIKTAHAQAHLVLGNCADHASGFVEMLKVDTNAFSLFTLCRAVLESASISIWIGRPDISSLERVTRSLSFRFEGIRQGRTFALESGKDTSLSEEAMDRVVATAEVLGILVERNQVGRPVKVGYKFPSFTDLAGSEMNSSSDYRLLSSMAHSHPFAMQELGYQKNGVSTRDSEMLEAQKMISNTSVVYLINVVTLSFSRAVAARLKHFGYLLEPSNLIFQRHLDRLYLPLEKKRYVLWSG